MPPSEELLVFHYEGLAARSRAFFGELNESKALSEQFLADPVRVLSERVLTLPQSLTDVEIGKTNRFLFSLLSNEGFMGWANEWQQRHEDAVQTRGEGDSARVEIHIVREELYHDLANAIWEHGDREALNALIGLDLEETAQEQDLSPDLAPAELIVEESNLTLSPFPKPVNFNVAVNAAVHASVAVSVVAIVVAILVIPVAVIGLVGPETVSREDLQRLTGFLAQDLSERAVELRRRGELRPYGDT